MDERLEEFKRVFPNLEQGGRSRGGNYRSIEITGDIPDIPKFVSTSLQGCRFTAGDTGVSLIVDRESRKVRERRDNEDYSVPKKQLIDSLKHYQEAKKWVEQNVPDGWVIIFPNECVNLVD